MSVVKSKRNKSGDEFEMILFQLVDGIDNLVEHDFYAEGYSFLTVTNNLTTIIMEKYKGFIYFALICLYILGSIGGIGFACYNHAYLIAFGVAAVALMALPQVVKYFKTLTDG